MDEATEAVNGATVMNQPRAVAQPYRAHPRPVRKSDAVVDALMAELVSGALFPGSPLVVQELCQRFGVSKQPVMDALRRLQDAGFVDIVPQVGVRVVDPRPSDVEDFFTVFSVLEGVVFAIAAVRRTADDLAHIESAMSSMDESLERGDRPSSEYRELNRGVHLAVHRAAHSPFAAKSARDCWDRSDFLISSYGTFDSLGIDAVPSFNSELAAALQAGDAPLSRRLAEAKILRIGTLVGERMRAVGVTSGRVVPVQR